MPKSRKRKATVPAPPPPPPRRPRPRMEYRARSDEAWYGARVVVQDRWLRVMFENSTENADEWYNPGADFASLGDVEALRARFRRECPPLDHARCGDLRPGDKLCLACDIHGDVEELKYYDAVLETVKRAAHGVEQCACRFTVRWTEGPRSGCLDKVGIEVVCCVPESPIQDPVLSEFLDDLTKRFAEDQGTATAASQQADPTPMSEDELCGYSLAYSSSNNLFVL
nr:protein SAWADEE HOMEODOMAIN HOMOLOG 2-like [Aegilops tauschii subsp. strangulata]